MASLYSIQAHSWCCYIAHLSPLDFYHTILDGLLLRRTGMAWHGKGFDRDVVMDGCMDVDRTEHGLYIEGMLNGFLLNRFRHDRPPSWEVIGRRVRGPFKDMFRPEVTQDET